jgi:succinate dehydrogenase / fumarate reductase cytochrome b subunit
VKDNRPVNLDINTIQLPVTAYASILHRVSGVAIFVGVAILLCLLDASLESAESFAEVKALLADSFLLKLVVWAVLCGFIYHSCAGVKHLIMDLGIGETLEGGKKGATIVLIGSVVLMLLAGVWVW